MIQLDKNMTGRRCCAGPSAGSIVTNQFIVYEENYGYPECLCIVFVFLFLPFGYSCLVFAFVLPVWDCA